MFQCLILGLKVRWCKSVAVNAWPSSEQALAIVHEFILRGFRLMTSLTRGFIMAK